MSEPPDKTPESGTADRTDNHPSVRSVAVGAASIAALFGTVAAFVVAGPIGLAVAAGVTLAGGAAVARSGRRRTGRAATRRPGLLHALVTRPRRPAGPTPGTGKLSWPLTGNQSRRAKGKSAGGSSSTGRKRAGLPQLPALTAKAKRAAAGLAKPHTPATARKAAAPRAAARPGAKPGRSGGSAGRAGARTPSARAASRAKPTTTPGKAAPRAARPTVAAGRRAGTRPGVAAGGRRAGAKRSTGTAAGRSGLPRVGVKPSTGARPVRRHGQGVTKPGMKLPRMSHRPATTARRTGSGIPTSRGMGTPGRRPAVVRRNGRPKLGTVPTTRRLSTTLGRKGATTRAKRIGDMSTPVRRRDVRRATVATPNRTAARPRPITKQPTRALVRTAMRVPTRTGWKVSRPTQAAQRRARRHLALRSKVAGRRGLATVAKSPVKAAKAGYRNRPMWLWPVAPGAINPAWLEPTLPEPKLSSSPGQKRHEIKARRNHRQPYPTITARRAPQTVSEKFAPFTTTKGTTTMSATDAVADAFASVANYQPQSAVDFERFLAEQSQAIAVIGQAYRTLAQRATSDMPFASPVADAIADLGAGFAGLEKIAGGLPSTLRAAHPVEFTRIDTPRVGEELFNPDRNQ